VRRLDELARRALWASGAIPLALRWRRGNPLILMYHGVTRAPPRGLRNCEGKHVALDRFVAQLRVVKRHRRVLPLSELVRGVVTGADVRNTVAITFDDGYENNVTTAAPALADLGLPATFFLATSFVDAARWIWVDRLELVLDRTAQRSIRLAGLGEVPLDDRRRALVAVKRFAKGQPDPDVARIVAQVEEQCGAPAEAPHGDYGFMSWAQARQLKEGGFDIGAHSVNHPILSRVDLASGEREMLESRDAIRRELGACSEVFCYPNGKAADATPEIMACAARHFFAALGTERGPARTAERYALRRIGVEQATTPEELAVVLLGER
jgi:peptidoglycan/xylan/chitin deacetylase (PgdA/CDA1 family)